MKARTVFFIILALIILIIGTSALFTIDETEQAIITQFGRPVGGTIQTAGLHFKIPFIQKVIVFEKRLLEWDGAPQEIPTKDNKFIHIDTFARWKIDNPLSFYKSIRTENAAQSRLDDLLDGAIRDEVAIHTLQEIVRSSDRPMSILTFETEDVSSTDSVRISKTIKIKGSRKQITENVVKSVRKKLADLDLGISVADFRFKRIDYNKEVQEKVFQRMISEQNRIAEKYRAIGQGEKERILGMIEQRKKEILSKAYRESQTIRGKADGEATNIYAAVYNQSAQSRDFYSFMRTLTAYQTALDSTTTLLLSTDNEFLKFLDSPE